MITRGFWEIPIEWEILVSVSDSCLDGYVPGWIDKEVAEQLPAKITYRLWSDGLGDLGTIEITKLRTGFSEVHFSGVPSGAERLPLSEEEEQALQGLPQTAILAALNEKRSRESARRGLMEKHLQNVIIAYFNRLKEMNIWPVSPKPAPQQIGAGALPIPEDKTKYSPEDWAKIFRATSGEGRRPDFFEIAKLTGRTYKTVKNAHSEWRDREGDELSP